jgi:Fe-S-cluster containining protein
MKVDWSEVTQTTMFLAALQILHACLRCGRCCSGRMAGIAYNSTDVARMAKQLGISKTEFMKQYTIPSPNKPTDRWLTRQDLTGNCPFLGKDGCTQYEGRGQVCRLYPYTTPMQLDRAKQSRQVLLYAECPGMESAYTTVLKAANNMLPEAAASILASDMGKYCMLNLLEAMHGTEAAKYAAREIGLKELIPMDRLRTIAHTYATAYCTRIPQAVRAEILHELEIR